MRTTHRTSMTRTGSTLRGLAVAAALLVTATACADGADDQDTDDDPAGVEETVDDEPEDDTADDDTADDGTADDGTADDGADDAANDTAAETAATGGDSVALRNINFEPADLEVAVGTTVTFANEDIVRHTVTAGSPDDVGDAFDEELDGEGDTITVTFDEEGTVAYFCRLHPAMTGTIAVG